MKSQSTSQTRLSPLDATWQLGTWLFVSYGCLNGTALAQIIPDNSTPTVLNSGVAGCPGTCITGGHRDNNGVGPNVFHSFEAFNVASGATVTFNNAPNVTNIFSRITNISALNASTISGTLGVNGPANLFLLNPNGIVFSNSAALNIQGSFLASTADSLLFDNGQQFSALDLNAIPSLLTVSAPTGLQFGSAPSPITVQGSGHSLIYSSRSISRRPPTNSLQVLAGENLALLGGALNLQGGNLLAPGGHVELGSIGSNGQVSFDGNNPIWQFGYEQVSNFQDILIAQEASIDVSHTDAGSIQLQGKQINIRDGSALLSQVTGTGSGEINLNASEKLQMIGANVRRRTDGTPTMPTSVYVEIAPTGTGNGNSLLTVNAPQIELTGGAQIGLTMAGAGLAGNVKVQSQGITADGISNAGPSSIFTTVAPRHNTSPNAMGGNLTITTQQFNILNGSQIAANTFGPGSGGDLTVNADTLTVTGFGTTAGGTVPSRLETSSQTAPSDSLGPPGVTLLIPSGQGSGKSGSAIVNARRIVVADGGQITTGTNSNNAAGNLTINASESITLSGQTADGRSGLLSGARVGSGTGGDITVNTAQLSVLNGATINTSNFPSSPNSTRNPGTGAAGNINLTAQTISVKDDSVITADTVAGDRANITITTEGLVLRRSGRITTNATGPATGGNINISTESLIALENSDITANAADNFGGRVVVNARTILGTAFRDQLTSESDITATSALGPAFSGTVELHTPAIDPTNGLSELPEGLAATDQIVAACEQLNSNTFVSTGRGGLPENASQPVTGQSIWNDFRALDNNTLDSTEGSAEGNTKSSQFTKEAISETEATSGEFSLPPSSSPLPTRPPTIVEAQTWTTNEQGQVVLGTYATTPVAAQQVSCLAT
ncbi:MAG: filamentous hemagglutinin N-terminal domain-containing protein [Phormidesmis sp. RL_2_1]|nr:filamentous hemagglutinin N-terminal domain-containing protein [Phormidesmis sp. RL_2_1]